MAFPSVVDLFDFANVGAWAKMTGEGYGFSLVFCGHQNRLAVEPLLASEARKSYQIFVHGFPLMRTVL